MELEIIKGTTIPPLFPVGSLEPTPGSPSSTESSNFSAPSILTSHRDSVSTTSTASSSMETTSECGGNQRPQKPSPLPCTSCGGPTRPQLFQSAETTTAVPTTAGITRPHSTEPTSTLSSIRLPGNGNGNKPVKHDPLSRNFPKPNCGATIEEMLARDPGKWSLNRWIKKEAEVRPVDKEAAARRFAETKAALLKSHREMAILTLGSGGGKSRGSGRARTD